MCVKLDRQDQNQPPEKQNYVRTVIYHDYFIFTGGENSKERFELYLFDV